VELIDHHLSRLVDIGDDRLNERNVGVLLLEAVGEGLQLQRFVVELRPHVGFHQLRNFEYILNKYMIKINNTGLFIIIINNNNNENVP
jgi:hypothetical protein